LAVRCSSTLAPLPVVGAVGGASLPGAAGGGGAEIPARTRSRSILGSTNLPSTASAGLSVTASEPEPLSPANAILKSRAAIWVCDSSMPPSNVNLLASVGGRAGTGWPERLTRVAMKPLSESVDTVATPDSFAFGPSSLSLPLKPSLPLASSARLVAWPSPALAPTSRSILSGAPLTVALPASVYGPLNDPTEAVTFALSAVTDRPALESLKIRVPFSMVSRPSDNGVGELGLAAAGLASATDGVNSQLGFPSALISSTILGSTSVTSSTSSRPVSSANSAGFTVIDLTSTMLGFFEPGALKNLTAATVARGTGRMESDMGPSITRSRPVACLAIATISGFHLLRSYSDGATSAATISTPSPAPAPIRSFRCLEETITFSSTAWGNTSASFPRPA
jgi:hypothetical protein